MEGIAGGEAVSGATVRRSLFAFQLFRVRMLP